MAFLNRFLASRKKGAKQCKQSTFKSYAQKSGFSDIHDGWKPFDLPDKDFVRVLLYRECDVRGRKLLFDSKTVQKVPLPGEPTAACKLLCREKPSPKKTFVETTTEYGYQYLKPSSDVKVLMELIFGSVAMAFRGTTHKIHSMKCPAQLVCSRVFPAPRAGRASDQSLEDSLSSSVSSMSGYVISRVNTPESDLVGSCPLDVPSKAGEDDSGFGGETSFPSLASFSNSSSASSYITSPVGTPASTGLGSSTSLQRRWMRNWTTSFEFVSQRQSCLESSTSPEGRSPRTKLGLSVVVNMDRLTEEEQESFRSFTFTHLAILESTITRLQDGMEKAYLNKNAFVQMVFEAVDELKEELYDLYTAPRLSSPLWLTMMSQPSEHAKLTGAFLSELGQLVEQFDTKNTNFFLSTLLTAVLTHHLAWVPTVAPSGTVSANERKKHNFESLDELNRVHPYNPLWAQLGDLMGAIGHPRKVARTLLLGKTSALLDRFLWILTYFIRCNEVRERKEEISDSKEVEEPQTPTLKKSSSQINDLSDKVSRLCRVPRDAILCHLEAQGDSESDCETPTERKVVFVLGDNDKLQDLKPQHNSPDASDVQTLEVPVNMPLRERTRPVGSAPHIITARSTVVQVEIETPKDDPASYLRNYNRLRFHSECSESDGESDSKSSESKQDRTSSFSGFNSDISDSVDGPSYSYCHTDDVPVPMAKSQINSIPGCVTQYGSLHLGSSLDHYNSGFILHGSTSMDGWQQKLQRDLCLATQYPVLDEEVSEAICIVADTETWEVQLVSSHTYIVDKPGTLGIRAGMSQLVANMLESLMNLWKLNLPPDFCLAYLEDRLQEIYLRSQVLAEYLLSTSLCNIDQLTGVLDVEVNDIPLLLAVASIHTPKVTQMYGLSFR